MNHISKFSRREFLTTMSAAAMSHSAPFVFGSEPTRKIPIGVQLWTLRREIAADMEGTLRRVAEIGYEGVELWFQQWPKVHDLKKCLDQCKLKIASAHVGLKDLLNDFDRLADYHRELGNSTLVIPYIPDYAKLTNEDWQRTIDEIRLVARRGTEAGFTILYHNHDFEMTTRVGDQEVLDLIFGTIEPKILGTEIDVFFVADVGRDPVAMLKRFSGRLKRVHLKEKSKPGDPSKNTELGRGVIDWPAVLAAAAAAGTEWYLVEQNCEDRPALESIGISLEYLRKIGA